MAKTHKPKSRGAKASKTHTRRTITARVGKTRPPAGNSRPTAEDKLAELKRRLLEIDDFSGAASVLSWDQATYMPKEGAAARGRQGATLRRLAHEKFVDPALGRLVDALAPQADNLSDNDACLVRVVQRDFAKAIKVPAEYVARANALGAASYDAWTRARPSNDFAAMVSLLEQLLDLSREYAEFFAPYEHIADPFIDDAEEGMTTATVQALFAALRRELVPIVRAITEQAPADDRCPRQRFAEPAQPELRIQAAGDMGRQSGPHRLL